jgi:hypothetical protein
MQETKEHIKTRMLKNAARLWGYTETEAENNFDPLVSLLLTACATELEKISGEIQASRARVLERLIQLLSPDTLTGALPAHAVATALSVEDSTEVHEEVQWYTRVKLPATNGNEETVTKDIFFSPAGTFHLNKASVRYMASGNRLFKINSSLAKEVIAVNNNAAPLPESTLWLGIDEPGISLHQCLCYFDFRNEAGKQLFYHQLPRAKWFLQAEELHHLPGYGSRDICGETFDVDSVLNQKYSICNKLKKQVNSFYKACFITLLDPEGLTAKKEQLPTPEIIAQSFTGREAMLMQQQPLRWIALQFPETISNRLLQDVVCNLNCFPVINRRLHDTRYRIKDLVNIIPLATDDIFLDLQEVYDDENKNLPVGNAPDDSRHSVLLRKGGVGRFDERNAAGIIECLLHLLRDESAAFSSIGNDFMNSEIKLLQQVINKLEQRLLTRQIQPDPISYLIFRIHEKQAVQNLFIKYWSTNGQEANNLKAGTSLQLYKGISISNNQAKLVTATRGGHRQLTSAESVLAYKSALLSQDRMVTAEDIKSFCHYQLGEKVKRITVQKGVAVHPGEQQGFLRTIDVLIDLYPKAYQEILEKEDLVFWQDHLKLLLQERSTVLMHYRVFINKAA